MNPDNAFFLLIAFALVAFIGMIGALGYFDYRQKITCIERSGMYAGNGVCVFPVAPAQPERAAS